jgi:hypothetical protein
MVFAEGKVKLTLNFAIIVLNFKSYHVKLINNTQDSLKFQKYCSECIGNVQFLKRVGQSF